MNILDYIPGILIFSYLIYYLVNRFQKHTPTTIKSIKKEESNLRYLDLFAHVLLQESDIEFDENDLRKIISYLDHTINKLSSEENYDILCELNVSIDGKIYYHITSVDNEGAFYDNLINDLDKNLRTTISKYPKYYNCHGIVRFYNDEPILSEERLSELTSDIRKKIVKEVDENNNTLAENFKTLSKSEKIQFIQNYVNENGFTRLRKTIWESRWRTQDQKLIIWLLDKIYNIQNTGSIRVSEYASRVDFWLFQLEFLPHFPYIPIILGSFLIHDQQYNYAFHFFNLALKFIPGHSWLYAYCLHLVTFIRIINNSEKELIEKTSQLIDNAQFEEADTLLKAQKKLNPYSALVNSEILRLEKIRAYDTWSPEKEQEYLSNYLKIIYENCDPFFEDENILQGGIQTELNKHRKTIRDCEDLYKMYIASIHLGESLFEATYAIMICSDAIFYEKEFEKDAITTSISRLVKEKPQKIKEILDHYENRGINHSNLNEYFENEDKNINRNENNK